MAGLVGYENNNWAVRGFAAGAVLLLGVINVAGVKWVIKLQFLLSLILLCAGLNFMVGSFIGEDTSNSFKYIMMNKLIEQTLFVDKCNLVSGFTGWSWENFVTNFGSNYQDNYTWFRVFGIFFPTITGVLSGINMSGDLRAPSTDIPNGTLAAFGTS